jgi:heme/copper-type cytochrome/quinol oxidase subunit 1
MKIKKSSSYKKFEMNFFRKIYNWFVSFFNRPNTAELLRAAGSIMDIGGYRRLYPQRRLGVRHATLQEALEADREALRGDWEKVIDKIDKNRKNKP